MDEGASVIKFVNPRTYKSGESFTIQSEEVVGFTINGDLIEDMKSAEKPTEQDMQTVADLMADHLQKLQDKIWECMAQGIQNTEVKPVLYSENYRSALLDKHGKLIKKID